MKLSLSCPECQKAQLHAGASPSSVVDVSVDIQNEGLYSITCDKNHHTLISIQNPKFEILFEIASFALQGRSPRIYPHLLYRLTILNQYASKMS